jgi:hypothetical protein
MVDDGDGASKDLGLTNPATIPSPADPQLTLAPRSWTHV